MTRSSDSEPPFDVDVFLARPLVARLATTGPAVRPIWFLWEDSTFWWLTGSYSRLAQMLHRDPRVALVVDTCDLVTGRVQVVSVRGVAEVVALDRERAIRKFIRYLGADEAHWDERFRASLFDPSTRLVRLVPSSLRAWDRSFLPADSGQ
jgi:nitroimidazol reductase NimA-like FMN-containing flavoprotein (pyridoxamine 5'-phosphate oxidase superfamily)